VQRSLIALLVLAPYAIFPVAITPEAGVILATTLHGVYDAMEMSRGFSNATHAGRWTAEALWTIRKSGPRVRLNLMAVTRRLRTLRRDRVRSNIRAGVRICRAGSPLYSDAAARLAGRACR